MNNKKQQAPAPPDNKEKQRETGKKQSSSEKPSGYVQNDNPFANENLPDPKNRNSKPGSTGSEITDGEDG